MKDPLFLTLAEVVEIHRNQIQLYGGDFGMRDLGLLQSALAQPQASFAGDWLHQDVLMMAAAYVFHICRDHPFIDGNKRVALASGLVFLELNGCEIADPQQRLYSAMMKIAQDPLTKDQLAQILKNLYNSTS